MRYFWTQILGPTVPYTAVPYLSGRKNPAWVNSFSSSLATVQTVHDTSGPTFAFSAVVSLVVLAVFFQAIQFTGLTSSPDFSHKLPFFPIQTTKNSSFCEDHHQEWQKSFSRVLFFSFFFFPPALFLFVLFFSFCHSFSSSFFSFFFILSFLLYCCPFFLLLSFTHSPFFFLLPFPHIAFWLQPLKLFFLSATL